MGKIFRVDGIEKFWSGPGMTLQCDGCGTRIGTSTKEGWEKGPRQDAAQYGWEYKDGRDLCPACIEERDHVHEWTTKNVVPGKKHCRACGKLEIIDSPDSARS